MATSERMTWLDANRFFAALGVVLIHTSTDTSGQPYTAAPPDERLGPAILRGLAEISSSELFLVFSLFLLAFKLERRQPSYGQVIRDQTERLMFPLLAWSVFYAFFRLMKAYAFGYDTAMWLQLADWKAWVGYVLLGSAQYHLHFLPTMFGLVLLFPAIRAAARFPMFGLLILPFLYCMDSVHAWLWGHVTDPLVRDYLVRAVKIVGYLGYGFAAFSAYGIWRRGFSADEGRQLRILLLAVTALLIITKSTYVYDSAMAGRWLVRSGAPLYAHLILPAIIFWLFLSTKSANWSPLFSKAAQFTYGVYLVHPVYIDVFDVLWLKSGAAMVPTLIVVAKYLSVLAASFCTVYLLSHTRPLAWVIGIGPVPFYARLTRQAPHTGGAA